MPKSEYFTTKECSKSLPEMITSLIREANMRRKHYPQWVMGGRMTAEKAQHEIECMESAANLITRIKQLQDASEDMKAEELKNQQTKLGL